MSLCRKEIPYPHWKSLVAKKRKTKNLPWKKKRTLRFEKHKTKSWWCTPFSQSFSLSEIHLQKLETLLAMTFFLHKPPTNGFYFVICCPGLAKSMQGRVRSTALCFENGAVGNTEDCWGRQKTQQEKVCVQAQTSRLFLETVVSMERVGMKVGTVTQAGFHCNTSNSSLAIPVETLLLHTFRTRARVLSALGQA